MVNIKKLLGARIRELRKRRGFTQEKLAEQIGIETRNLLNIENARTFPRAHTLERLISVLGVSPDELFTLSHCQDISLLRAKVFEALKEDDELVKMFYKLIS